MDGQKFGEDLSENLKLQIRSKREREREGGGTVGEGSYARTGGPKTRLRHIICIRSTEVLMKDKPNQLYSACYTCRAGRTSLNGRGYQIKTHQIKAISCSRNTEHAIV